MLKELTRQSIDVVGIPFRLPLFALLYLEEKGLFFEDLLKESVEKTSLLTFAKAAIVGGALDRVTVEKFDLKAFDLELAEELARKAICETGLIGAQNLLIETWNLSLPKPIIGAEPEKGSGKPDLSKLKSLFCDIMKASETDFWLSTLREISERWDTYAEIKGFKEPVQQVSEHYQR